MRRALAELYEVAVIYRVFIGFPAWIWLIFVPRLLYLQAFLLNPMLPVVVFCFILARTHCHTLDPLFTAERPAVQAYAAAHALLSSRVMRAADTCARALPALGLYQALMLFVTTKHGPCRGLCLQIGDQSIVLADRICLVANMAVVLALFAYIKFTATSAACSYSSSARSMSLTVKW